MFKRTAMNFPAILKYGRISFSVPEDWTLTYFRSTKEKKNEAKDKEILRRWQSAKSSVAHEFERKTIIVSALAMVNKDLEKKPGRDRKSEEQSSPYKPQQG